MCCWPYASFYDKKSAGNWYEYGNLFDILRQAGIHTAWLSNQEASGFFGSIGQTLAGRCDNQAFTSHLSHTIDLADRYDEEILPLLDAQLSGDEGRYRSSFYVLHLMGAHEDFKRRYPAEQAVFTADDESEGTSFGEEVRELRAEYDNAVRYDDAIVDAIIQRFEMQDAIVIFVSDHGEEVYDIRHLVGHGDESSAWQHDIPMVVWMSSAFQRNHADDAARIRRAAEKKWQSDEMIHTLLDLLKIRVPDFSAEKSILS
ncbi:phosphoethanolamine transferase [Mitsuokella sp.]|uniref:phosphoethanolamine transferase n=1 Tax=Mitsuokella sp. TaxID=2049034 RepID=UPI002A7FAA5D|nr:phosphoethanolamine transferase [Mitsuokella sp.]MDY4474570.1 phosphoethanolamine transferase [Mitsuokella sp.]